MYVFFVYWRVWGIQISLSVVSCQLEIPAIVGYR